MGDNNKLLDVKNVAKNVADDVNKKADTVKNAMVKVKDNAVVKQNQMKLNAIEKKRQADIKKYSPIFREDIDSGKYDFSNELIIRVTNYDKRLDNDTCKNSVGFFFKTKDRKMPVFYSKDIQELGFSFYPKLSESIYIKDPCVPGKYIDIDDYYSYMRKVRVDELSLVAQSLGAKSIEIELRDSEISAENNDIQANANAGKIANVNVKAKNKRKNSKHIDIWASNTFKPSFWGRTPTRPNILYFKNESEITSLIQMALSDKNKLVTRTYSFKASSSSGISLTESASINGIIKGLKCSAGGNFAKSAKKENNSYLTYTITFE